MNISQMLVPAGKYGIKCPYAMQPKFIVVHNTANDAKAMNEASYMLGNNNYVSYHVVIDDHRIIQTIPFNRNAWHCGSTNGNRNAIGIEICYSRSGGELFNKAEDLAAQYIAYLLKQYGWGIDKVQTHQMQSGKYCPHRTLDMGWQRFLNMISKYLGGAKPTPQPSQPAPAPSKPSGSNPNVKYQAFSRGKWWSDVINYNHANSNGYAGVAGSAITGIRFNTVGSQSTAGNLQGRAHVIGRGWQAWVTDRADYIGLYGKPMDMVQFNLINLAGKQINYRVHVLGGSWLPWVRGFNNANSNGYAGIPNRQIDMIQMYVS